MNNPRNEAGNSGSVRWLVMFFGLAYFMQHFAQAGLIMQPLQYYLKQVCGLGPTAVTEYLALLTIPWMIKPLYGLVSDFIPLFGYRRKSYLLLLNLLAAGGFLALTGMTTPGAIITALIVSAFGTAASDVIIDGLMVELGAKTGQTKTFQTQQWLWFNVAAVITSLAGGYFAENFGATVALKYAAMVTILSPLVMVAATWFIVKEEKTKANLEQLKKTTVGLWNALKSKTLWIVIAFLAFWQFSPSFGTPQYFYMTDKLKFAQDFIGWLDALSYMGSVVCALFYWRVLEKRFTTRTLMYASVAIGTVGTLAYLLIADNSAALWLSQYIAPKYTAQILSFVVGGSSVIAFLTTLNIAAEACPPHVEALTFAALMSVFNLAKQGSSIFGARLFENYFDQSLTPLIWVSAAFTFVCFFLIRFLPAPAAKDGDGGESK